MNIHNVNWSSKTWSTCSLRFVNMTLLVSWLFGSKSICLRPGIPTYCLHLICIALSRFIVSPSVSIRCFVSSALQLFASAASAEYLIVSGCVRFITGHDVVTPSSFVQTCVFHVLVSGMVIRHAFLASRTCQCQFWHFCRPYGFLFLFHFSRLSSLSFVRNVFCTCV